MTPYETAARWHLAHDPETPFREILEAHLFCGHVISGPKAFVLGRRVWREWQPKHLLNPWCTALDGDCWHVWLWAGEVKDWRKVVPFPLPWIAFHRGERLRIHRFPMGE